MAVDSENPAHSAELPDDRIFREARASDEAAIREILAHANLSSGAVEKSPGANSTHIGSTFVHVCQQDGAVVAVVQWRNLGEEAEILDIAVAEKHRRHGNARFLLKKFVELVRQHGIGGVFLSTRGDHHSTQLNFEVRRRNAWQRCSATLGTYSSIQTPIISVSSSSTKSTIQSCKESSKNPTSVQKISWKKLS